MTSNIKKSSQTSQIHKKVDEGLLLWKFSTHTVKKKRNHHICHTTDILPLLIVIFKSRKASRILKL